jgi:hypothetical protein
VTVRGPHLSHGAMIVLVTAMDVTEFVKRYDVEPDLIEVAIVIGHVLVIMSIISVTVTGG